MKKSATQERTSAVQQFIQRLRDQNPRMSYDDAWQRAKNSPELKDVFAAMKPTPADYPSPAVASRRARMQSESKRLQETGCKSDEASDCIMHDPIYSA